MASEKSGAPQYRRFGGRCERTGRGAGGERYLRPCQTTRRAIAPARRGRRPQARLAIRPDPAATTDSGGTAAGAARGRATRAKARPHDLRASSPSAGAIAVIATAATVVIAEATAEAIAGVTAATVATVARRRRATAGATTPPRR